MSPSQQLSDVIAKVRERISKLRGDKNFNEQNTKASLIVPVLQSLGWDTNDSDEVHWEYKPKPKYNPVDFALLLQRTPCLFLEAKALRETLQEDKLAAQILTYATVAGVQWVVLSNGDEYRVYNAAAPVPIEEKLFRKVAISTGDPATVVATLSLLSKQDLQDKRIGRLWESTFVDRQVEGAIDEVFNPAEPDKALVRAISNRLHGKLKDSEIRASLRRARLMVDFPEEPEAALSAASVESKGRPRAPATTVGKSLCSVVAGKKAHISLKEVILEGLLPVPAQLSCVYRGTQLSARVEADGTVAFEGTKYASPSAAGGAARKPFFKGQLKGNPATNGWAFWQVKDPIGDDLIMLDVLRDRFLRKKEDEANRFGKLSG